MKPFAAFFRLIRWPNLVFIALTQCMFYYCVILPVFTRYKAGPALSQPLLYCIIAASVLIAAAGYVINDYFDLHIDAVNKPARLVIDKAIKRRWAIVWHFILSAAGILISCIVAYSMHSFYAMIAGVINVFSVIALWLYSTTYKRKLLIGNVLIALLTAWTILILYVINLKQALIVRIINTGRINYEAATTRLFKYAMLYAGFAFIISLIREVVKDMEDIEGDAKYECKTMPIVWGVPATKVFVAVWNIVLTALLIIIQFYAVQLRWWWSVVYCILFIIVPLIWFLNKLYKARLASDYHRLSSTVKMIMFTGIVSMIFFWLYA